MRIFQAFRLIHVRNLRTNKFLISIRRTLKMAVCFVLATRKQTVGALLHHPSIRTLRVKSVLNSSVTTKRSTKLWLMYEYQRTSSSSTPALSLYTEGMHDYDDETALTRATANLLTTTSKCNHKKTLFEVTAKFAPAGDQPEAIRKLNERLQEGHKFSILQGITGTGRFDFSSIQNFVTIISEIELFRSLFIQEKLLL